MTLLSKDINNHPQYNTTKMRVKAEVAIFLTFFMKNYMSIKWFHATRKKLNETGQDMFESHGEWAERIARELSEYHLNILSKSHFSTNETKRLKWWQDAKARLFSIEKILEPEYADKIVWIAADTFIDVRFANNSPHIAKLNTLSEADSVRAIYNLTKVVTAWLRLRRNSAPEAISEAEMIDEMAEGLKRRIAFANRRKEEGRQKLRVIAREDPEKMFKKLNARSSSSGIAKDDIWSSLHVYAGRPRSRFHKTVIKSDPQKSLSRAVALNQRNETTHDISKILDYHLRLIPKGYNENSLQLREVIINTIKDKSLPNRKLAKILEALVPKVSEPLLEYSKFLHDIISVFENMHGLHPTLYVGEVLNALASREVSDVSKSLRILSIASDEIRSEAIKANPQSLKRAATAVMALQQADLISGIKDKSASWNVANFDRLISNSLKMGTSRTLGHLMSLKKIDELDQCLPERIVHHIKDSDITIEFTNITVPDGWMAMAVPGICVRFGGSQHLSHFKHPTGYICVYDKDNVVLGGFVVDTGDKILLNNLQGRLGNRVNKPEIKKIISLGIEDIFMKMDKPVVLRELYFNSLSLTDELNLRGEDMHLDLPKMYLDNPSAGHYYTFGTRR